MKKFKVSGWDYSINVYLKDDVDLFCKKNDIDPENCDTHGWVRQGADIFITAINYGGICNMVTSTISGLSKRESPTVCFPVKGIVDWDAGTSASGVFNEMLEFIEESGVLCCGPNNGVTSLKFVPRKEKG